MSAGDTLTIHDEPAVILIQSDTDPGDMGEPRWVKSEDGVSVVVPSFELWPSSELDPLEELTDTLRLAWPSGYPRPMYEARAEAIIAQLRGRGLRIVPVKRSAPWVEERT